MKSDNNNFNIFKRSSSPFNNNLIIPKKNSSSNINIKNNIQHDTYYLGEIPQDKEKQNISMNKEELEDENDTNIDNYLTKDIINSINEINYKSENSPPKNKNKPIKDTLILMHDKTESYEDEVDNINREDLYKEKELESPFDLNNCWNFNTNPNKIFNIDNQKNHMNNSERYKLNDDNLNLKIDVNSEEYNCNIKNKGITFKSNSDNTEMNNEINLENKEFFGDDFVGHNINLFQEQNNNINFWNNNDQCQNINFENSSLNIDNKIQNNLLIQKDLNGNYLNQIKKNEPKEDTKDNKLHINSKNDNFELTAINEEQNNILNGNNNFFNFSNNQIIYQNNYINLLNPVYKNKNINALNNMGIIDSHDSLDNNLNLEADNYLIKMFGKLGWICRICNNFNFESRCICNRCKAIKAPKTKEEINIEKYIKQKMKKKIKEKKVDWFCPNCQNINYGFRNCCNRCSIDKKYGIPLINNNLKLNENNDNIILMKNNK